MTLRLTEAQYHAILSGKPRKGGPFKGRKAEDDFAVQLFREGIRFEREFRFLADRKFRFDFMIDKRRKIAVEVDGVVHRIKGRFDSDREKHTLALLTGWRVLRVSPSQVRTGAALELLLALLARA